jgi:hypothetical protein
MKIKEIWCGVCGKKLSRKLNWSGLRWAQKMIEFRNAHDCKIVEEAVPRSGERKGTEE